MTLRLSACVLLSVLSSVAGEQYLKKVKLGDAVTLYCDRNANSQEESEIMWKTPYQLVAKLTVTKENKSVKKNFSSGPGFENRVRFENPESRGGFSLHINPTVFSDTDVYSCFSGADLIKTWSLQVTASPTEEVTVIERGTVTVPCYSLIDRQLTYDKSNIQWRKDGKVVLNLTEGTTHHYPDLDYRANIFLEEIPKGDLSLVIKDIKMTDEGNYECFTENNMENILSTVHVHVIKGINHGYRQRVLHYEGDSFTFFVSTNDVEIHLITTKKDGKRQICKIRETGAKCQKEVYERAVMHQGYLTLKDLSENDEGTYAVVDIMDKTLNEIVLEVRQLPFKVYYHVVLLALVGLLFSLLIRRKCRRPSQKSRNTDYL